MGNNIHDQEYTEIDVRNVFYIVRKRQNLHWSSRLLCSYISTYGVEEFCIRLNAGTLPLSIRHIFKSNYNLITKW